MGAWSNYVYGFNVSIVETFSYHTIDHPSVSNEELDDGMSNMELSEEQIDNFLLQLFNHSGYMIFYYDTYETDDLYANRKYRLTMKQQTKQNDKLVNYVKNKRENPNNIISFNINETIEFLKDKQLDMGFMNVKRTWE